MICSYVLQLDQSIYLKSCSGPTIYLLSGGGGGGDFLKKIEVTFKKPDKFRLARGKFCFDL